MDGADEFDPDLNLIKGGGGALLQEKIVASASDQMIVIADIGKEVETLGAFPLPVEVIPFGWQTTQALIEETLLSEETRFKQTLDRGLKLLDDELAGLPEDAPLPGDAAFKLYDNYGFPLDLTQDALREQGRQVDIIKLYGGMELAPIMGLADLIVDIVDTGNTLKANGLEPRDLISHVSSRLVASRASMKVKYDQIQPIIDSMAAAVARRDQTANN